MQILSVYKRQRVTKEGFGLISGILSAGHKVLNKVINLFPVELYIPSYNYCELGTKLTSRLARGEKGIHLLDETCKEHYIAYSKYIEVGRRREAGKIVTQRDWSRAKSRNPSMGDRSAPWAVTTAMKAKTKLGNGKG